MKSKNQIAQTEYGNDFDDLWAGEKAAVTRKYNAQSTGGRVTRRAKPKGTLTATIGRVGVNGSQTCILAKGATVGDLVTQSGYDFDENKEGIVAQSTGNSADLSDAVVHNETYAIAPEIESNL